MKTRWRLMYKFRDKKLIRPEKAIFGDRAPDVVAKLAVSLNFRSENLLFSRVMKRLESFGASTGPFGFANWCSCYDGP